MSDLSLLANSFTSEFTGKFLEISLAISNTFSTLKESDFSKLFAKHPPHPESYCGHDVNLDAAESVDELYEMLKCDKK